MYLIATDEAGYGPKLGPLVIVATAWRMPTTSWTGKDAADLFAALQTPTIVGNSTVVIDDSKRVYKSGDGLNSLHAAASIGLHWRGTTKQCYPDLLEDLCGEDLADIAASPWLAPTFPVPLLEKDAVQPHIDRWSSSGIALVDVRARVITAKAFNTKCSDGFNKADVLSHATLGLVSDLVNTIETHASSITVYCDRHGGRRYYAAPVQHHFPDWLLRISSESKEQSRYRLTREPTAIDFHFTVKGDRFAPVAYSSIFAKYLRERFMESFNAYFAERHTGNSPLKATAGYPVDADRFLEQVSSIRCREDISDFDLVRQR